MPAPSGYLGWIPSGNASYITDPPAGQKATGWLNGEAPPFEYMNWLFYTIDQWLQYLAPSMAVGAAAIPIVPTILVTTGALGIGSQTLTVASAVGLTTGMGIAGTYILPGTYIQAISGTTITMSTKATSTVVSETITFSQAIATGVTIGAQLQQLDARLRLVNPVGTIVATFPGLTGAYACTATTVADSAGLVLCGGQTINDATSPMNGAVIPNINDSCFIMGLAAGGDGTGAASTLAHTHTLSVSGAVTMPAHTHNMTSDGTISGTVYAGVPLVFTESGGYMLGRKTTNNGPTFGPSSKGTVGNPWGSDTDGVRGSTPVFGTTAGIVTPPSVGFTSTGTSASTTVNPKYISAVYCMYVK